MLNNKDIEKLLEAMKIKFPSKIDFEVFKDDYKKDFSDLQVSVDAYAEKADKYFQEMTMLTNKADRHGKWLEKSAEKLGIDIEY